MDGLLGAWLLFLRFMGVCLKASGQPRSPANYQQLQVQFTFSLFLVHLWSRACLSVLFETLQAQRYLNASPCLRSQSLLGDVSQLSIGNPPQRR